MVDSRVSTSFFYNTAISDIGNLGSRLADMQRQIASGQVHESFFDQGSEVIRIKDIETNIKRAERYSASAEQVSSRLNQQDLSMEQLQDLAAELQSQIVLKRSASGAAVDIASFSQNALAQVQDALNTRYDGRFLFSGTKTDVAPVSDDVTIVSNIVDGAPTANYYQGDDVVLQARVSENLVLDYGVRANEEVFQNLIGAFNLARDSENFDDLSSQQGAALEQAGDLLETVIEQLAARRSAIDNDMAALENVIAKQEEVQFEFEQTLVDLTEADVVDVSIRAAEMESILQAVMQTFARISSLTLSDYLR